MTTGFGDFKPLCSNTPSYPWCNLFYRQIQENNATSILTGLSADPATAPVGINPSCGIPLAGTNGSLANIANIIACGLSVVITILLIIGVSKRKAAVCRVEFRILLGLYLLSLPLQLLTTGSFLRQGSLPLVILTAIHAGVVAATFWALLGNAIISTQVVEDGTLSSLIPFSFLTIAFFAATTYISLDTALGFTSAFGPSNPIQNLKNVPLFVLTSIWPGIAALLYIGLMLYIVLGMLNELRPMWYYILAAFLFVLSQLDYFLLSKVICNGTVHKVDGSFVATILETASIVVIYVGWRSITEDAWEEDIYYPR